MAMICLTLVNSSVRVFIEELEVSADVQNTACPQNMQ
jgi:hypothetical protein